MLSASDAIDRLRIGNQRVVAGGQSVATGFDAVTRAALAHGQHPFAVVLACADSRVPVEAVFDEGPGALFVVRVAGNVADASQIGSIEYAVSSFDVRLVLVLGHTQCGGIIATVNAIRTPGTTPPGQIGRLVDSLRPPVETAIRANPAEEGDGLVARAGQANVHYVVNRLQTHSSVVKQAIVDRGLQVVGAEYSLSTGRVEFLDGLHENGNEA